MFNYPPVLVLIVISLISKNKPSPLLLHMTVCGALLGSLLNAAYNMGMPFSFVTNLPLYALGFSWFTPTIIFLILGLLIDNIIIKKKEFEIQQENS